MSREFTPPLSTPIDRGWAWMVVVGMFLQLFCFLGIGKSMGLITVELARKFDVSMATAILPATVLFSTFTVASPLALIAGEIFSIRAVVIFGSLFGFTCILLSSLLYSVMYYILVFGIGIGVGGACYYGNGLILLGKYFRRHRSLANGLALAGTSLGHFVLPPIIEYLLREFGLAGTTLIISAIFLHGVVSGALFRPIAEVYEENDVIAMADRDKSGSIQNMQKGPVVIKAANVSSSPSECPDSAHDSFLKFQLEPGNDKDQPVDTAAQPTDELEELVPGKQKCSLTLSSSQYLLFDSVVGPPHKAMSLQQNTMTSDRNDKSDSFDSSGRATASRVVCQIQNSTNRFRSSEESLSSSKRKRFLLKLSKAMDFSVLKNYVTLYYTLVALLSFFGYMNIVLYFPAIFMEKGISVQDSAMLVLVSGGGEILSRVGMGFLADKNFAPRYVIMGVANCLTGLDVFMLYFAGDFWWTAVLSFMYGVTGGTYICLVVVVLVDLVGLAELNRNMAVILLIEGVGSALGQPFLGALKDVTGSCNIVIILCSASSLLGGLLELSYPMVRKFENRRLARRQVSS